METDLQTIEREIKQLSKADEEAPGRFIGIAAVVALLPGAASVQVPAAKAVIADLMQYAVGADAEVRNAAERIAYATIKAAPAAQSRSPKA